MAAGNRSHFVHHSRSGAVTANASHSRWFWSTTFQERKRDSRFLVLVEDITERVKAERELEESKWEVIQRLVRAAEYRDRDTGHHVQRMSRICEALARAAGLSDDICALILKASQLHDIGKIGIPDSILRKEGKLTSDELAIMRSHATLGAELLADSNHPLLKLAETIAMTHHERWDGTGYPKGLKGEDIPIVGRIASVCDVFDALLSERPYKQAMSLDDALAEIQHIGGTYLDPNLTRLFFSIVPQIKTILSDYSTMDKYDMLRDAA
jgi:putative two-component system response regulator